MGDLADSVRPGVKVEVTREAVGVVAIISPWNFPTATAVLNRPEISGDLTF